MNAIVFLLPLLLLIPIVSEAHAEQGSNYDRELLEIHPDGSRTYSTTLHPYDRVYQNGVYKDYLFSDIGTHLELKTATGKVQLDKNTCAFDFYDENDYLIYNDSIIPYNSIVDLFSWNEVTQISEASCEALYDSENHSLIAQKQSSGVGLVQYKYTFDRGTFKTTLEATNLTSLTNRVFGFDQTIDLNTDLIDWGGNTKNLDNFNGTTFDRNFLENNETKVINFLTGFSFNLGIGFDYLDSITVFDTGVGASKLVFHFMRNNEILLPGDTLIIDPTYGPTASSNARVQTASTASTSCSGTFGSSAADPYTQYPTSAATDRCLYGLYQWDTSSIPDGSVPSSMIVEYTVDTITGVGRNCDWKYATSDISTIDQTDIDDAQSGTVLASNDSGCATAGSGKTVALSSVAYPLFTADLAEDRFNLVTDFNTQTRDGSQHYTRMTNPNILITIIYTTIPNPDAVDDLISTGQTYGSVDLSWTQPDLNTGNLTGYQINYTTPYGSPDIIITNNTESSDTTATVSGLSIATDYSFRIGVWTEGSNKTGNILNVTTQGNFTIGTATFNQTNTQVLPITFEEQSINSTAKFLNVTYANTYTLACDFHYKFANTNQTYSGLTGTAVSTTLDEVSFIFNDFDNEIIDVYCWDKVTNTDADYLLIQSDFPLLQQMASFRAGDYGTEGKIGVFDFITIAVVIFSMIGLNRVNESVGAVFNIALLGALSYFGIIELPTVIFGIIAVVMVFVITSTRKT